MLLGSTAGLTDDFVDALGTGGGGSAEVHASSQWMLIGPGLGVASRDQESPLDCGLTEDRNYVCAALAPQPGVGPGQHTLFIKC